MQETGERDRSYRERYQTFLSPLNTKAGRVVTVGYRAIEIDSQEAVSRFLNVHGKSGGQSVNF